MAHLNNLRNEYADELETVFDHAPKTVLAAVAVSALTIGGDYLEEAKQRVVTEWNALHAAGIVPQPVPTKLRHLIRKDSI